ncbi:hypothetical protein [Aulosira sp. FACHB-615]|uniref:hypothetical protein n=1 Tax=Aulosira sp. FACHB-615 TaxID=2692777 RepID=UPI00168485A2|nr:hypothetical protein [Aulosira sp. FACHB-615]MBD2491271.1 hypothetical protein [Aulosira sp. FACHB-615]
MTVHYQNYKGLLLEIFFTEDGFCYAACESPLRDGVIQSETCLSPGLAFDALKQKLDSIYFVVE